MENFLKSLGATASESEGTFSIAADRARQLLSERVLNDPWQAWTCLFQGFQLLGAASLSITVGKQQVDIAVREGFEATPTVQELLTDDRFLLAWLNLDWFGIPRWQPEENRFSLVWKGSMWKRYRSGTTLRSFIKHNLAYKTMEIDLDGQSLSAGTLPERGRYTVVVGAESKALGMLPDSQLSENVKICRWESEESFVAAVAYKSGKSWSEVRWVHHGVLIKEERNTLERPGLAVTASVDGLGLSTDLSGFGVIHNERYLKFANLLKKEVLWML